MTKYSVLRPFALGKVSDYDWRIFSADGLQIGGSRSAAPSSTLETLAIPRRRLGFWPH